MNTLSAISLFFAFFIVGMLIGASTHGYWYNLDSPFLQQNFPCQEDEALQYAPQFGPDRVGCLPVESAP